jgi:hypothetical protein
MIVISLVFSGPHQRWSLEFIMQGIEHYVYSRGSSSLLSYATKCSPSAQSFMSTFLESPFRSICQINRVISLLTILRKRTPPFQVLNTLLEATQDDTRAV